MINIAALMMKLDQTLPDSDTDGRVLAATFAARVQLAKTERDEALVQAGAEWDKTQLWVASNSQREGSFCWYCDTFDLDASAVRRAIRTKA